MAGAAFAGIRDVFDIDFGQRQRIIDRVSDLGARGSWIGIAALLIACSDRKPAPAPKPTPPVPVKIEPSTAAVTELAIGETHTCALHADQTVSCWGANQVGQLGIANLERGLYPAAVPRAAGALAITAVDSTTCILRADHTAYCWGHIGEHAGTEPSAITTGIAQISGRCFRRLDGGVECLQDNAQVTPIEGITGATSIASYRDRGCAVHDGGRVTCWLPDGVHDVALADVTELTVDANGMCALRRGGIVQCSTLEMPIMPTVRHTAARGLVGGGGGAETCIRTETDIECWTGADPQKRRPLHLPPTTTIARGLHSCFVKSGRDVQCWGAMLAGQLGNGWWERRPLPTRVPGVERGVEIGGSRATPCVRHADNTLSCWGNIVVDGTPTVHRIAVPEVRAVPSGDFLRVVDAENRLHEASYHTDLVPGSMATFSVKESDVTSAGNQCFVTTGGRVRCWKTYLAVDPKDGRYSLTPAITDAAEVASVTEQGPTCTRHRDGRVGCFSQGSDHEKPTVIDDATAVAVSEYAQCAIRADHSLWCWGSTMSHIFGQRPEPEEVAPAQVPVGEVVAMAMVRDVICVVKKTGAVACWGDNEYGQLGDGTFMPRQRPADVIGITDAIDVHVGLGFACALHRTGHASCWGTTGNGQVGTYATSRVVDPVPVAWP